MTCVECPVCVFGRVVPSCRAVQGVVKVRKMEIEAVVKYDPRLEKWLAKRRRREAVTAEVLSNTDLVACILQFNVGLSTFASASAVSRAWLQACRSDEGVLRSVALYQGGLTKAALMRLFALPSHDADALPRTSHARHGGGRFFLYREPAVDALLGAAGMEAWRCRLRARTQSQGSPSLMRPLRPRYSPRRAPWQEEDRLHALVQPVG